MTKTDSLQGTLDLLVLTLLARLECHVSNVRTQQEFNEGQTIRERLLAKLSSLFRGRGMAARQHWSLRCADLLGDSEAARNWNPHGSRRAGKRHYPPGGEGHSLCGYAGIDRRSRGGVDFDAIY
jgi:hypothetical protein